MSASIVAVAILVTGAQANIGQVPPTVPGPAMVQAAPDQQIPQQIPVPAPPTTAAPPLSAAPPDPAAPPQAAAGQPAIQDDVVVTGRRGAAPGDPLEGINAQSFEATQAVDRALIGPAAQAYRHVLPRPVRDGVRNFLGNLREPAVFVSYVLQLKPGKAAETLGRFVVNSTIGIGGLVDVAKDRPFNLPHRFNGFADTLGFYGVKQGAFLFVPLIGPTTVRDLIGDTVDRMLLPLSVGAPFNKLAYTLPTGVARSLDHRAEFDSELTELNTGSADPYTASREYYLRHRQAEIDALRGKHRGAGDAGPAGPAPAAAPLTPPAPATGTPLAAP
jgi:phospholipid-binding lipoprotein MlaA